MKTVLERKDPIHILFWMDCCADFFLTVHVRRLTLEFIVYRRSNPFHSLTETLNSRRWSFDLLQFLSCTSNLQLTNFQIIYCLSSFLYSFLYFYWVDFHMEGIELVRLDCCVFERMGIYIYFFKEQNTTDHLWKVYMKWIF